MSSWDEPTVMTVLGPYLRELREGAEGLLQKDVAALGDLDPSALSQIETGKRKPDFAVVEAYAQAVGMNSDDIWVEANRRAKRIRQSRARAARADGESVSRQRRKARGG